MDQWGADASKVSTQAVEERNKDELNTARDSWLAEDFIALGICIELVKGNEDTCKFIRLAISLECCFADVSTLLPSSYSEMPGYHPQSPC